ncbi:MAG: diguanylate cyclase [Cryptosporangiaceae bacterium]|nr:diguanylate cyclase [Cryptosporangiaceae bacterium]
MSILPGTPIPEVSSLRLIAAAERLLGEGDPGATRVRNGRLSALLFAVGSAYIVLVAPFVAAPQAGQLWAAAAGWVTALLQLAVPWRRLPGWTSAVPPVWAVLLLSATVGAASGALLHYTVLYGAVFAYTGLTLRPGRTLGVGGVALAALAGAATLGRQHDALVELTVTIMVSAAVGELIALAAAWHRHARAEVLFLHRSLGQIVEATSEAQAAQLVAGLAGQLLAAEGVRVIVTEDPGSSVLVARGGVGRGADFAAARIDMDAEQSGVGTVMRTGAPLFIPDASTSPLVSPRFVSVFGAGSVLYIPLPGEGGTFGVIVVWWAAGRRGADVFGHQVLTLLSAQAGPVLARLREVCSLDEAAATDPLTGAANRRGFDAALTQLPVGGAVVVFDLDRFKPVNDIHGHTAGDDVLASFAETLRGCVRDGDVTARLGGDEFAVLLPTSGQDGIDAVLARLAQRWAHPHGVTYTAGSALRHPGETTLQMLIRADDNLYAAKRGRSTPV